jgi:hypothetical protein
LYISLFLTISTLPPQKRHSVGAGSGFVTRFTARRDGFHGETGSRFGAIPALANAAFMAFMIDLKKMGPMKAPQIPRAPRDHNSRGYGGLLFLDQFRMHLQHSLDDRLL